MNYHQNGQRHILDTSVIFLCLSAIYLFLGRISKKELLAGKKKYHEGVITIWGGYLCQYIVHNSHNKCYFFLHSEFFNRSSLFGILLWLISAIFVCIQNFLWQNFTYWDDWLRLKENHKGRQFIRPEVCRTYNFGEHVSFLIVVRGSTFYIKWLYTLGTL